MSLRKIFLALSIAIIMIISFAVAVSADETRVYDMNNMLTENEIERINEAALKAESERDCRFYIVTLSADGTFEKYEGEDFIEDKGLSYNDDIVLLIITYDNVKHVYYYNVYYYGMPTKRISEQENNEILDSAGVFDNIKAGKLADGAIAFIEISADAVRLPWGVIITVAVLAGVVVCALTVSTVTAKYKMRMNPTNYPLERYAKLDLTDSNDKFLNKNVAVVFTSPGGPGGPGGRGGGGGGGYGGGRGHAGGR